MGVGAREGSLIYQVDDYELFATRALELPDAMHFAAAGNHRAVTWFNPAARTREDPFLDDPDLPKPGEKIARLFGCRLDMVARESVTRFILKCSRKPFWPGAVMWHWWLYTDEHLLVSAYDWPDVVYLDKDLSSWAEARLVDEALRVPPNKRMQLTE